MLFLMLKLPTVSDTSGCDLCKMRELFPDNTYVAPQIGTSARISIGEAPGEDEQLQGKPFVGGAGRIRDGWYAKTATKSKDLTVANCIQCRPPDNLFPGDPGSEHYISKADAAKSIAHCIKAHVEPLLKGRIWKRVDLLGEKALRFFTGKKEGIFKWRGSPLPVPLIDEHKPMTVPTIHPAAIMRFQKYMPAVLSDLKKSLIVPPEHYNLFPSVEDVQAFTATTFAFDIENNKFTRAISMVGLCNERHKAICVPFKGAYIPELKRIFADAKEVIGQNCIQHDLPILEENLIDIDPECQIWDIMLMHHLVQPDLPHDLEFISSIFTNKPGQLRALLEPR